MNCMRRTIARTEHHRSSQDSGAEYVRQEEVWVCGWTEKNQQLSLEKANREKTSLEKANRCTVVRRVRCNQMKWRS